jgi:hypothetical protein
MSKAPAVLVALLLVLTVAAGAALTFSGRPSAEERQAEEFHRLVGGIGFGPALDLERCEFSFDPRLCAACANDTGPVPGGLFFCPYHAGSILDPPPLPEDGTGPPDAPLP